MSFSQSAAGCVHRATEGAAEEGWAGEKDNEEEEEEGATSSERVT